MKFQEIDDELLDELTAEKEFHYESPVQIGPLRQFDNVHRCASRGCSSPTYFKVSGVPYCMIHALRKLNDMLVDLGVEK